MHWPPAFTNGHLLTMALGQWVVATLSSGSHRSVGYCRVFFTTNCSACEAARWP